MILCYSSPNKLQQSVSFQLKRKVLVSCFFCEEYMATWCFSDSTGLVLISSPGTFIKLWMNYLSGPSESQLWGYRVWLQALLCSLEPAATVTKSEIQNICKFTSKNQQVIYCPHKTVQTHPCTANSDSLFLLSEQHSWSASSFQMVWELGSHRQHSDT